MKKSVPLRYLVSSQIVTSHPYSDNSNDKNMCIMFSSTTRNMTEHGAVVSPRKPGSYSSSVFVCVIVVRGKDEKIRKTSGFALKHSDDSHDEYIAAKIAFADAIKHMKKETRREMWKIFMSNICTLKLVIDIG